MEIKKPKIEDFGDGMNTAGYVEELEDGTTGWLSAEMFMRDEDSKVYEDITSFMYPNLEVVRAIVVKGILKPL